MTEQKRVLVIDDDADVRYLCETILRNAGYAVSTADSGETGLAMAESEPPDLVLLDIIMERIDTGYSVADKLARQMPVILFSSMINESDLVFDSSALPVRAILTKPLNSRRLLDTIGQILGD
jgi:CheY-like chemotaxis protein